MRQAEQNLSDATDRVEQLRGELHQAIEIHTKAKSDHHHAQAEFDRADRRALDAQRRAEALEKSLVRRALSPEDRRRAAPGQRPSVLDVALVSRAPEGVE